VQIGFRENTSVKTDAVYKRAFNEVLDLVVDLGDGAPLPSENGLSARLGVSRTTVRKILSALDAHGAVGGAGRQRFVRPMQAELQRYPEAETVSMSEQVEKRFMEWMLRGDTQPGSQINELDLARQFGVGTAGIREFLNRFRRFGLIEKRPNAGWRFKGFTEDFAVELFEIREMFELRSAARFATLEPEHQVWASLSLLEAEHHDLLAEIDARFHDFSDLDNRFHRFINSVAPNRFIDDFYEIITFIFHYHYQWNKRDEGTRNEVAVREHLAYIAALKRRDPAAIETACRTHLASAKATLLRSTVG
jgi:DNA-binding GntR family transcriptional regulator